MPDLINKKLGQHRILEEIGRGGMATVYKARDAEHGRHVALKVLHAQLTVDALFVKRFRQEAAAASSLSHPNIVAVYDVGQEAGLYYLVMEYLVGQPLSQLIEPHTPWPLRRTLRVISQVADALDYAHRQGFIHRDIKPSNIIIGPGDHATLTDFGIAKATSGTTLTRTGMLIGTPQYMSPEQCLGKDVDSKSDIYSLGVVLYEMLTGRVPFSADNTPSILYMHVHETMASPAGINPDIPLGVERVAAKALAKQPESRYSIAGEMASALERALAQEPASEEIPTIPTRPLTRPVARARRRNSWLGVAIAAAAIALGALFIASLAHLPRVESGAAGGGTGTPVVSLHATPAPDQPLLTSLPVAASIPSPTSTETPPPLPTATATVTHTPTAEPTPTSSRTATPTSVPPTATPLPPTIVVDGLAADWYGWAASLEDQGGDSQAGANTDLRAVYVAETAEDVYIMVAAEDSLMKGQATVELNLDLRPGSVCACGGCARHEVHSNINAEDDMVFAWKGNPCGPLDEYPMGGAVVSWWDVLEIRIPKSLLGEHSFIRPTWVCFWTWFDGEWRHVDCMPR
jgi:serine/threonine protein kinase